MQFEKINPFKINGMQQFQPVTAVKRAGSDSSNPFSNGEGFVGLGIKDGSVQTSNGQMGRPVAQMRQLGIA